MKVKVVTVSDFTGWVYDPDGIDVAALKDIMVNICHNMADAAERYGTKGNYVLGANIAGFERVAEAMTAQGIV